MRGEKSMATAVRGVDGKITIESSRIKSLREKSFWYKVPVVRGVLNFISMLSLGIKTLMRSSEVFTEGEVEPSKFEKWISEKLKIDIMQIVMVFAVVLGLGLAIGLFFILPQFLVSLFFKIPNIPQPSNVLKDVIEGVLRLLIFVLYVVFCAKVPDVKRVFMYHGAEHKTINCFEHEEELTVENVKAHSKIHNRCGTTFMVLVMVISIIVFSLSSWVFFEKLGWVNNVWTRVGVRLLLLPLVAGVSYEILKLLALSDNIIVRIIRWPGLQLQRLTTKEPDDKMIEVAIAAFNTVYDMDRDESIPEKTFEIKLPLDQAKAELSKILPQPEFEACEVEWILCDVLGIGRDKLETTAFLSRQDLDKCVKIAKERATHIPLQYVLGYTNFYGYNILVKNGVLIPRPETELLCEQVVKRATGKRILDLCTGSGAIAIATKLSAVCDVQASDLSDAALEIARYNAEVLSADVKFVQSDLFENIEGKFDIIVSNPPYIPTAEISALETEVKDYEPIIALDGGTDGLDFYRRIAQAAKNFLNENGTLILEIGIGQAEDVQTLLKNNFTSVEILNDYADIPRIVIANI